MKKLQCKNCRHFYGEEYKKCPLCGAGTTAKKIKVKRRRES